MFARVTTIQGTPDQAEEAIRMIQEQVIPAARQLPGFKGGYWLADRNTGKGIGITLWESEDAMRASGERAAQLRNQSAQALGGTAIVEEYEVIGQA